MTTPADLPTANFTVLETWLVECPHCHEDMEAPFNADNPMQPMTVVCDNPSCGLAFVLTYERDRV